MTVPKAGKCFISAEMQKTSRCHRTSLELEEALDLRSDLRGGSNSFLMLSDLQIIQFERI